MPQQLTVGQLARAAGVSTKTIRYYEQVGVLPVPHRSQSGYRQYARRDVHRLLFVRRARALGLSLKNLKTLITGVDDGQCATIRPQLSSLVQAQLKTVQQRLIEFQLLQRQLEQALHQLSTVPPADAVENCQCLDLNAAPPPEPSPPSCTSMLGEKLMDSQSTLDTFTILATSSGDHHEQCDCGCGCELPLSPLLLSEEAQEHIGDAANESAKTV